MNIKLVLLLRGSNSGIFLLNYNININISTKRFHNKGLLIKSISYLIRFWILSYYKVILILILLIILNSILFLIKGYTLLWIIILRVYISNLLSIIIIKLD